MIRLEPLDMEKHDVIEKNLTYSGWGIQTNVVVDGPASEL